MSGDSGATHKIQISLNRSRFHRMEGFESLMFPEFPNNWLNILEGKISLLVMKFYLK